MGGCLFYGEIKMAYSGYLIKVGNYNIPLKYIKAESYKVTYNSQDVDSYRDANGVLHRNALENYVPKVEFDVVPMLTNTELQVLLGNIRANYIDPKERKVYASVYIPETDSYVGNNMYLSDFSPEMYYADSEKIQYRAFRMAFIGYGE